MDESNTAEQREKVEFKLVQKTDKDIEIESLVAKEIPNLIRKKLIEKGIDAYVYTPHPLLNGPRIHIHSQNPIDDLISASKDVENDLKEFKDLINKEFKSVKKEEGKNIKKEERKEIKEENTEIKKEENISKEENKELQNVKLSEEKPNEVKRKRGRPKKKE